METQEQWKVIDGYSRYAVSNHGRVKNMQTGKYVGHRNNTTQDSKDVALLKSDAGEYRGFTIARLVGMCFGYQPPCLPNEIWKDSIVPGVMVSSLGRLFSTYQQRLIVPVKHESGYFVFRRKGKRSQSWKVHRLVALAFVPGRELFRDCIDHINEDKTDNRADNLRWCSAEENNQFWEANHPHTRSKSLEGIAPKPRPQSRTR